MSLCLTWDIYLINFIKKYLDQIFVLNISLLKGPCGGRELQYEKRQFFGKFWKTK